MEQSKFTEQITLAQQHLKAHKYQEALLIGQTLIASNFKSLDVYLILALSHQQLHQHTDALNYINNAINLSPTLEFLHLTRLQICKLISGAKLCLNYCKDSLKVMPNSSHLWYELSQIELQIGNNLLADQAFKKHLVLSATSEQLRMGIKAFFEKDYAASEKAVRDHLHIHPNDVNALRLLGEIALILGVYNDAQRLFERSLSIAPDYFLARLNYAHVLNKRERSEQALEQINMLEVSRSNHPPVLTIKASVLVKLGRYNTAIEIYHSLLEKRANQPEVWASLGHTYKTVGNISESIRCYHQALNFNSEYGDAYWSLANLKTYQFSDIEIAKMESCFSKLNEQKTENTAQICFALGKAYENKGNVPVSYKFYEIGNKIKGQLEPYNKKDVEQLIRNNKLVFKKTLTTSTHDFTATPIFIVGLPRSGSTLLEQILASHSLIDGTKELPNIIALARKLGNRKKKSDNDLYPQCISKLSEAEKINLGQEYIASSSHLRGNAPYFIDKMPNNFLHIGLIKAILPHAKIIDARRIAPSAGFSCFKQLFATGQNFSYDLKSIEHYYINYLDLMNHWKAVFPTDILTVHYENVVQDTQIQVQEIFSFLGLPFEAQCLSFYTNNRAVATASAEQVRQPINTKGLDAWRPYSQFIQNLVSIQ